MVLVNRCQIECKQTRLFTEVRRRKRFKESKWEGFSFFKIDRP